MGRTREDRLARLRANETQKWIAEQAAGAEKAKIKSQYHDLLKRFHPDTNGGDRGAEAKLQRVIKAWKTLKKAGLA